MAKDTAVCWTATKLTVLVAAVIGAPNIRDDIKAFSSTEGYDDMHQDEQLSLNNCKTSTNYPNLATFEFNPLDVPRNNSACLAFKMFKDMGFTELFQIPIAKLLRFIVRAQQGYRKIPFHNWEHGFGVLHFAFAVLKNCNGSGSFFFTPLEGLALLTAAMCHDIDHPGTNSKFQELSNSNIAQAHRGEGSILERHHIYKTFNLLRDNRTNFAAQLPTNDLRQFEHLVRIIILATDLTTHFKVLPEEEKMVTDGFDKSNEHHHHLLLSVVISSADLSHLTKDWTTARRSAKLVNTEFFIQGDQEKEMGLTPYKMMDRNQANIAGEQVNFISRVALPVFRVLANICNGTQGSIKNMESNLKYWQKSISYFEEQSKKGRDKLEILDDTRLEQIPIEAGKE